MTLVGVRARVCVVDADGKISVENALTTGLFRTALDVSWRA